MSFTGMSVTTPVRKKIKTSASAPGAPLKVGKENIAPTESAVLLITTDEDGGAVTFASDHYLLRDIRGHHHGVQNFYSDELFESVLCVVGGAGYSSVNRGLFVDRDVHDRMRASLIKLFSAEKYGGREPEIGEVFRGTIVFPRSPRSPHSPRSPREAAMVGRRPHLSYTAMTGKPVVRDVVLRAIMAGRDLTVFSNIGAFEERHLRVLVTMARTPLYTVKMVAREANTNPASAIDYCSSTAMARALINICHNVTCFSLYNQDVFRVGGISLHDDRKGADSFRKKTVVYGVLCERIQFGGDVLPPHVCAWFNMVGTEVQEEYMLRHKLSHMSACYGIYQEKKRQAKKAVVPYEFMVAYHRYSKYLPLTMYFRAIVLREEKDRKVAAHMVGKVGAEAAKMVKKQRKHTVKSAEVKQLLLLVKRMFGLGCCEKVILSFL